jgi:oxygen-dependent protoporphyrinogen oxidase
MTALDQPLVDSLIIGAGLSGLCAAQRLVNQVPSLRVMVVEQQGRVGGNITSNASDGFIWEEGPNSFSPSAPLLRAAVDAGLASDLLLADRKLPRFVYWQGQLQAVPMSPPALLSTRLLSDRGKLRAALGAVGFVPPPVGDAIAQQSGEETVQQFFERHLGAEVVERLVSPFMSGVYAGDPAQLSASSAMSRVTQLADVGGGLLAGAVISRQRNPKPPVDPDLPKTRPGELGSFKEGLAALPTAIAAQLGDRVKLNCRVTAIQRSAEHQYTVHMETPDGPQQVNTRSLVVTAPAAATANLLQELAPTAGSALNAIPYPPVACVVLAYPIAHFRTSLQGFGNLIPRHQGIRTLGTIWTSSLFPGRTPDGWALLTNFIGGATDEAIASLSDEQIVTEVDHDLRKMLLKPDAPKPKVLAVHLWKQAIPQYTLGHQQRLNTIHHAIAGLPGFYLCSNYLDGVALGDCARRGQETADRIRDHLATIGGAIASYP